MNLMVTTNQKPTTDTQKKRERNTSIPLKKIIETQKKKLKEEKEKKYRYNQKTSNKTAIST